MSSVRTYYVICEDNCKFEGMTKEEIFDAIAEATGNTPTPVDEAFITKIKEQNANHNIKIWKGTEAQYNALSETDPDTIYFVGTNEIKSGAGIEDDISDLQGRIGYLETRSRGHDIQIGTHETQILYDHLKFISIPLESASKSVNHGLSQQPDMWRYKYEVVQAYVVKDNDNVRYAIPYIYKSSSTSSLHFLSYRMTQTQIEILQDENWTGYTAYFVIGEINDHRVYS